MTQPSVIIVMGVSGCGKSTVASALGESLDCAFIEGDGLHSPQAVEKMRAGIPLTDEDRWPWLDRIAAAAVNAGPGMVVMSCSALRRRYRDRLRDRIARCAFAHLAPPRAALQSRVAARTNHFMPPGLLDSQLATLEPLDRIEWGCTVAEDLSVRQTAARILDALYD